VGTNHVALIAGKQETVGSLVDEHIEMVEPEIGHYFVELPLAVNRSQQLGLRQLIDHDLLGIVERAERLFLLAIHALHQRIRFGTLGAAGEGPLLFGRKFENGAEAFVRRKVQQLQQPYARGLVFLAAALIGGVGQHGVLASAGGVAIRVGGSGWRGIDFSVLLVLITLNLCFVNSTPRGIARHGHFAFGHLPDHFVVREILDNLAGIHLQRAKWRQPRVERRIVDFVRMELQVNPLVNAHLRDAFEVAGAWAERQPI